MYGKTTTRQTWLSRYKICQVHYKDSLYQKTLKYLKKQKHLQYSKIFFLLTISINKKYPIGYVLIFNNNIVGFVGTIFSQKNVLNCNIHSWLVDKNHRIVSSLLFNQIYKKKCTITILSSLPRLGETFIRLGFKEYYMKYKIVFIRKIFRRQLIANYKILTNVYLIKKYLNKKLKKILSDYSNKNFKKIIFTQDGTKENCFIIANIVLKKKIFKTLNIIYCSNPIFLERNLTHFYNIIESKLNISICGEFFIDNKNSILKKNNINSLIRNKKIYVKANIKKFKFDLLYSEVDF